MGRVSLYYHTVKNMKPSQVFNRLRIKLGKGCPLGVAVNENITNIQKVESPESLDFDPVFIARFPVAELMEDTITILHSSKKMDWKRTWEFEDKSALWNFNLHYFEYLFPLVKAWKETGDKKYLGKTIQMIEGWIDGNLEGKSPAWASYTIALRIVNWISWYGYVGEALGEDFREKFLSSLHEQYKYLAGHLEKDILGNHYFEDLKSIVLVSIFFKDNAVFKKALADFKAECKEEILPDGMHFELSPMYHKIIFEGMMRVAVALRGAGRKDQEIENYLQPMLDVAYSFEDGLERVPLFNDGGNNVTKSLDALVKTAGELGYKPKFRGQLQDSGFYIFQKTIDGHTWKLVVDAGQPGPKYIPGHAHCDAMSFELFCDGKPVVVNCGTYAYQCKERSFFRSTAAHNTVMVDGTEQSQCWGAFRLAKRSQVRVLDLTDSSIAMEMTDQKGQKVKRTIELSTEGIVVTDKSEGHSLLSYAHIEENFTLLTDEGCVSSYTDPYAVDYGEKNIITTYELHGVSVARYSINSGTNSGAEYEGVERDQYRGYKPLAFINNKLYFYRSGKLWTVRNGDMRFVADVMGASWKDRSRPLIRLFRREPKFAVTIDEHRLIVAGFRKLLLVDVNNKDIQEICRSRQGFSDPLNICKAESNWIAIWGDYGSNPNHDQINIYGLKDDLTVETIYSFQPGQIRHIHNIIPRLNGGYFIFTGDQEECAGIYLADADFKEITPLKTGKQQYRAVVGFDTPSGLLYATDAVNEQNYLYLLKEKEPEKVCELNGSCIYGTSFGERYYFATTVEPDENNRGLTSWISRKRGAGILSDDVTLVRVSTNMGADVVARYKKDCWPMKLMQYGSIQFPHGHGDEFWIYPVAVKGIDGRAVRINEV